MPTDGERGEARLVDAFLARRALEPGPDPELGDLARQLAALGEALDAGPSAAPELVAATLRRTRAELAASDPSGLAAALARLGAALALPFAAAVAWNAAVWWWGPALLGWLPEVLARGIPAAYVFGAAGWLALLCAALPSLAHHQLARRHREALS